MMVKWMSQWKWNDGERYRWVNIYMIPCFPIVKYKKWYWYIFFFRTFTVFCGSIHVQVAFVSVEWIILIGYCIKIFNCHMPKLRGIFFGMILSEYSIPQWLKYVSLFVWKLLWKWRKTKEEKRDRERERDLVVNELQSSI